MCSDQCLEADLAPRALPKVRGEYLGFNLGNGPPGCAGARGVMCPGYCAFTDVQILERPDYC